MVQSAADRGKDGQCYVQSVAEENLISTKSSKLAGADETIRVPGAVRRNAARALSALTDHGEMSRAELATMLELPKSTVVGVVDDLIERGLVTEGSPRPAGRAGRPAKVLSLAGPRRVVGVAVWSVGKLRVAIADPHGQIMASGEEDLDLEAEGGVVDPAADRLEALLGDAGLDRCNLNGVVVGVPAPLQRGFGRPHNRAGEPMRKGWIDWLDHDPSREVESRLGVPAVVENDANLVLSVRGHSARRAASTATST